MNTLSGLRTRVESAQSLLFDRADEFDAVSGGIPFRETTWIRPWFTHFGRKRTTCFVTVIDDDDRIRGILPLKRLGSRGWQTIGADLCTDYTSVLVNDDDRDQVTECLADFLLKNTGDRQYGWDRLHFEGVVAGDPTMSSLLQRLTKFTTTRLQSRTNVWFRSCSDDWETYLQKTSNRRRRRERAAIALIEDSDSSFVIRFSEDEATTIEYTKELVRLHQQTWQSKGWPGTYGRAGMKEFIQDVAMEAFRRGRLRLPAMFLIDPISGEEIMIAAQLHFLGDDQRLYCYSVAVNYEYADLTPGNLLNAYLSRMAHDGPHTGIDFMRGDEEYKKRMGAEPLPLLDVDVFAPTRRGRFEQLRHDWLLQAKQLCRQKLGRPLAKEFELDEAFAEGYRATLPVAVEHTINDDPSSMEKLIDEPPILLSFSHFADLASRANVSNRN